jgi:hypothetical protein
VLRKYLDRNEVDALFTKFRREFKPGEYGAHVELMRDGAVRLTAEHFSDQHQVMYPKKLPPAAVKFAWVPEHILAGKNIRTISKSSETFEVKRLPHEVRGLLDTLENDAKDYYDRLSKAEDASDVREVLKDIKDTIKDIRTNRNDEVFADLYAENMLTDPKWGGGFKPVIDDYLKTKDTAKLTKDAWDAFIGIEQGVHDHWGDTSFAAIESRLVKIAAKDLNKL